MRRFILLIPFLLAACGHSYPEAQTSLSLQETVYQLRPNDIIKLHVFGEDELTGTYTMDSEGKIALPLIGKLSLQSQTEQQAIGTIRQALQKQGYLKDPKVTVELTTPRPFFVMGEVEKAGAAPFQTGMTVYQAVALAGGYTYRADRRDITIRRQTGKGPGTEQRYNATEDTPVLPGDVIEIGERYF